MSGKRLIVVAVAVVFAATLSTTAFGKLAVKPKPSATTAPAAAKPAAKATPAVKAKPAAKPAAVKNPVDALASAGPNAVVAVVNGEKITKKQLSDLLWGNQANYILDRYLINNVLIQQRAKKEKVSITDKDVAAAVKDIETKNLQGKSVDQALAEMGISKKAWIEVAIKPNALRDKIIEKGIKVTDADIAAYISARHILVRTKPSSGEEEKKKAEEEAKTKCESIKKEIDGGKDFAEAADQYSEDPSNTDPQTQKKKGGLLDWFKKGRMIKQFEDAAFALKAGEMVGPVQTYYGYHLIKMEKLGKDANPAEKEMIKKMVAEEKKMQLQQEFYSKLREGGKIDNKLSIKPAPVPPPPPPKPAPPKPEVKPAPKPTETPKTEAPKTEETKPAN